MTAAQRMQERASKALDMITSQNFATGRQNKDHAEGPALDVDMVMKGVTVGWLAQAFGMNHTTVKNKLRNCPPLRAHRNGFIYDIRIAVPYLIKPRFDIEEWLKNATASDLPPKLQREYWGAKQSRLKYEEDAGHLWRGERVMELFGKVFLMVKAAHQQWGNALETSVGLSDVQITILVKLIDQLESDLWDETVKLMGQLKAANVTKPVIAEDVEVERIEVESNYEEEDEDDIIASIV